MTETEFEILAADRGHGDLRAQSFAAHADPPFHPHPWSTLLLVTAGQLTIAFEDDVVDLGPGEWCEVAAGRSHSERTGAEPADVIIATRPVATRSSD